MSDYKDKMHQIRCRLGLRPRPRCLKCTKFGQLVLAKIIKIVATRCQIIRLKCTKFDVGWGSYTALPQTPLAGFKGAYF